MRISLFALLLFAGTSAYCQTLTLATPVPAPAHSARVAAHPHRALNFTMAPRFPSSSSQSALLFLSGNASPESARSQVHEQQKAEPLPTQWPAARFEPIPTRWPKPKVELVGGQAPGVILQFPAPRTGKQK